MDRDARHHQEHPEPVPQARDLRQHDRADDRGARRQALGLPLSAYIRIRPMPGQLAKVAALLNELDPIVECDRVTGEDCFVAKAHLRDIEALEVLIDRIIPYAVTNSAIQSSPVKRRLPPLPEEAI